MSLYSYCVARLDVDETWEVFPGVEDRPVFAIRYQRIALLVSRLERVRLEEPRHVVQHGQVIHRVFEGRPVLPFRFGTTFATEEQAQILLRQNHDQFTEALRVLRGKAEMRVKLQFRVGAPGREKSHGTLHRPAALAAAAGACADPGRLVVSSQGYGIIPPPCCPEEPRADLSERLAHYLRAAIHPLQEQVCTRLTGGQMLMDFRYLVEEAVIPVCQKLSWPQGADLPEGQIQVTGPWPPFHFLPVTAKLPARGTRLPLRPGRLPLRARAAARA
jgi:hypothetical protein